MTNTIHEGATMSLEKGLAAFLDCLAGKNRSRATLRAYKADILQFITFLTETDVTKLTPADVSKLDCLEYLSFLAKKGLTGVARARKLAAIREYFRFLEGVGVIAKSPTVGIETPKREKHTRAYLPLDFGHSPRHQIAGKWQLDEGGFMAGAWEDDACLLLPCLQRIDSRMAKVES
jgi:site-specific recombinase XerC